MHRDWEAKCALARDIDGIPSSLMTRLRRASPDVQGAREHLTVHAER